MSMMRNAGAVALLFGMAAGLMLTAAPAAAATITPFLRYASNSCTGTATVCEVAIVPSLAANRRLEVNNVACLIRTDQDAQIQEASSLGASFDFFVPTRTSNGPGVNTYFAFNEPTLNFVKSGDSLVIHISATKDVFFIGCKVAGRIIQP